MSDYNDRWEPYKRKVLNSTDARIRDGAFRASDVSHSMHMETLDCSRMLKEMCEKDQTLKRAPSGKSGCLRYTIKPKFDFLRVKIRNVSNEELGIEPDHLGAPE